LGYNRNHAFEPQQNLMQGDAKMPEAIPMATTLWIRDCELDEVWLQDQIAGNPACLQLGELELVSRERQQAGGGRLDILLKDPQDDSMYEVEVMLGETDETHIVRTIEYWDREKRKWPQRQHFAVLVAETITSRFFNVIQLLSHSIPIVAVQANIVEVDGKRALHFSKVLDTYEEPEEDSWLSNDKHDEGYWQEYSPWTLDAAKALLEVVRPTYANVSLNLVKYYIAIEVSRQNYLWLHKRGGGKSLLKFWTSERLLPQAMEALDAAGVSYVQKNQEVGIIVDSQMIQTNGEMLSKIAAIVQKSWQE
jgi:hypothetical protein